MKRFILLVAIALTFSLTFAIPGCGGSGKSSGRGGSSPGISGGGGGTGTGSGTGTSTQGGASDEQVADSKPEVKVFEGVRQPVQKSWTYLVYCPVMKEAALVDASCDADELESFISEKKLELKYIFISHNHGDHVGALGAIQNKFASAEIMRYGNPLEDNEYIRLGESALKIFYTPGHASDCIVIWTGNMLFTGDSFDQPVGREETAKRLKGRGGFIIYGGHGCWQDSF